MADLTTLAGIEAELSTTADYDVAMDVSKAKRRVAALRRRLDFPQSSGRGEQNVAFAMQAIENQLQQVLHSTPHARPTFRPISRLWVVAPWRVRMLTDDSPGEKGV